MLIRSKRWKQSHQVWRPISFVVLASWDKKKKNTESPTPLHRGRLTGSEKCTWRWQWSMAVLFVRNLNNGEGEKKRTRKWGVLWSIYFFRGRGGRIRCCVPITTHEAPLSLSKQTPELISAQQRVMERGLSLFCQAFDGVIDWARGIRDGEQGLQKKKKIEEKRRGWDNVTLQWPL